MIWDNIPNAEIALPLVEGPVIKYYENSIYIAGGQAISGSNKYPNGFYRFNLGTRIWQDISNPYRSYESRYFTGSCIVNDFFYLIYGWTNTVNDDVYTIDRVNLTSSDFAWEYFLPNISFARDSYAIASKGPQIYIFGGYINLEGSNVNDLIEIDTETAVVTELTGNSLNPLARMGCTMHVVEASLFVIAGMGLSGYYNDLWKYSIDSAEWTVITQFGSIPSARSLHAGSTEGDAIAIWGGVGDSGLLGDMFVFNTLSSAWSEVISSSATTPQPAKGACMVLDIPLVYIFGGISGIGCLGQLWVYDSASSEYALLSNAGPALAYAYCRLLAGRFYVMFGESISGQASSAVLSFDLSSGQWSNAGYPPPSSANAQGIQLLMGSTIVRISGEAWDINTNNEVLVFNTSQTRLVGTIPEYVYLSGSEYHATSIYSFGGGGVLGRTLRASVPVNLFIKIDINDICSGGICEVLCSPGTFYTFSGCEAATAGYYSEGFGNTSPTACPPGTYNDINGATSNRQCYPCAEGSFTPYYGASFCGLCPSGFTCPIGSTTPSAVSGIVHYSSDQPVKYTPPDITSISLQYELVVGLFMLSVILTSMCWEKIKRNLDMIDIYPALHNHITKQPMILDQTYLGGMFSLMFLTAAMLLIGLAIITYNLDNINEIKALVPLVVLSTEVPQFVASEARISVDLLSYGDSCGTNSTCSSLIHINFQYVSSNSTVITCVLTEKTCRIQIVCVACVFQVGSSLSLLLGEELSYASGISVNISSTSSIPGGRSNVSNYIYPQIGNMFIGSDPTVFYFGLTPSLFETDSSEWPAKDTGYHVAPGAATIAGSQFSVFDLPINSQLEVLINLDTSNYSLFTTRMVNQTFIFLVTTLLGSVFGIMGTVGAAMKFIEGQISRRRIKVSIMESFREVQRNRTRLKTCVVDLGLEVDPLIMGTINRYTRRTARGHNCTGSSDLFSLNAIENNLKDII